MESSHLALAGVGRSWQDASLFAFLSVAENMSLALERARDRCSALAVHEMMSPLIAKAGASGAQLAERLSYGQRHLVATAMACMIGDQITLLDEPFAGVADALCVDLLSVLRRIASNGTALVLVEHRAIDESVVDLLITL
jgi:ABC-type branched-subunit amino acid transport system ATPase component